MSSFPLISHHLFVAAVKEKCCDQQVSGHIGQAPAPAEIRVEETQRELVEDIRSAAVQAACSVNALSWTGLT
jgi:hypothetical protein